LTVSVSNEIQTHTKDEYHFHLQSTHSPAEQNLCKGIVAKPGTSELPRLEGIHPISTI
jgi:hypothetical protein